jgi:ABC-2 type transport system ATP-binding protein
MPEIDKTAPAIEVEHLVKRYRRGKTNSVDDISFQVRRGETFGLLGPNGAGKTTTIGILTTSVLPTGGRASVGGADVTADPIGVKQRIAVVPQRNNLDRSLRVSEILTFHAAYHGVAKAERNARAQTLLAEFGLQDRGKNKIGWFSGGMEQRVMVARALMHDPEVLFLDEPTNNLDPQSRLFLWERIRKLHAQGVTIVLTTHDMEEADQLCDRIAIMDHGRILALDTPEGLKRLIPGGTRLELRVRISETVSALPVASDGVRDSQSDYFYQMLEKLPGLTKVEQVEKQSDKESQSETLSYRLYANSDAGPLLASAVQAVLQERGELLDLRFTRPTLEDVFIYLTGRNLRV